MANYDWSKFSQKIYVNAPLEKARELIATRNGFERWFLRKAEFRSADGHLRENDEPIQKGDTYEWLWHGHPDTTAEHGTVTEANGTDTFQFIFGQAGTVTMLLEKAEDGVTRITITQAEIPTDEVNKVSYHLGCSTGWAFYLVNLKSILEGGLDLRNKNLEYKGVINS